MVTARVIDDDTGGAPWEQCDGHGPVSEWTARDKRPGERVLCEDRPSKRFYDFAEAVRIAKRDGWDTQPYGTGTANERAARAAEADYKFLRSWCNDDWRYIGVAVTVTRDGATVFEDALFGIESCGTYWREHIVQTANDAISADVERAERAYWHARDVVTA